MLSCVSVIWYNQVHSGYVRVHSHYTVDQYVKLTSIRREECNP